MIEYIQVIEFYQQLIRRFQPRWVRLNTIDGTDSEAGRCCIETDAFSATLWVDFIDFCTFINRLIGTFRQAHITIDTCVGNDECHINLPNRQVQQIATRLWRGANYESRVHIQYRSQRRVEFRRYDLNLWHFQ